MAMCITMFTFTKPYGKKTAIDRTQMQQSAANNSNIQPDIQQLLYNTTSTYTEVLTNSKTLTRTKTNQ